MFLTFYPHILLKKYNFVVKIKINEFKDFWGVGFCCANQS